MSGACSTALGSVIKKTLRASEQQRADVRQARELWIGRRKRFFNKALARLVFIDETSTNTKLTKRTGWSPKGERYQDACAIRQMADADLHRRAAMPRSWSRRGSSTRR